MDLSWWPYRNLLSVKTQLEDAILAGDLSHKESLKQVDAEIVARRFILIATLGGKMVAEYDRFRTKQEAEAYAAGKGVAVDQDFLWDNKSFKTRVVEI